MPFSWKGAGAGALGGAGLGLAGMGVGAIPGALAGGIIGGFMEGNHNTHDYYSGEKNHPHSFHDYGAPGAQSAYNSPDFSPQERNMWNQGPNPDTGMQPKMGGMGMGEGMGPKPQFAPSTMPMMGMGGAMPNIPMQRGGMQQRPNMMGQRGMPRMPGPVRAGANPFTNSAATLGTANPSYGYGAPGGLQTMGASQGAFDDRQRGAAPGGSPPRPQPPEGPHSPEQDEWFLRHYGNRGVPQGGGQTTQGWLGDLGMGLFGSNTPPLDTAYNQRGTPAYMNGGIHG